MELKRFESENPVWGYDQEMMIEHNVKPAKTRFLVKVDLQEQ